MVDKELIQRLYDKQIIDKRHVLWWQLGFEGRRIFSEEEFKEGLEEVSYNVRNAYNGNLRYVEPHVESYQVWTKDEVPILLKETEIDGEKIPCFASVKPMSHPDSGGDGWSSLEIDRKFGFPLPLFYNLHIRGVVIEETDRFLFWYPIIFGDENYYSIAALRKENELPIIVSPIRSDKFYKNLIKRGWSKGRRAQKRAKEFDCEKEGFKIVPYFEFNPNEEHIMVYPVQLFENELDFPVFIKSSPNYPRVEVMGIGYAFFRDHSSPGKIYYWDIQKRHKKLVRETLERNFRLEDMIG